MTQHNVDDAHNRAASNTIDSSLKSAAPTSFTGGLYTAEQIRRAEQPLIDAGRGDELMQRAAYGLAQQILSVLTRQRSSGARAARRRTGVHGTGVHSRDVNGTGVYGSLVTGLIGKGNNGGDGLYALSYLARRGVAVQAILCAESAHPEALNAFQRSGGRIVTEIGAPPAVLLDAILGTGFSGEFQRPNIPGLQETLAYSGTTVVACDIPSGVNASTGRASEGVICADLTVTFGGLKIGLTVGNGSTLSGSVELIDIGLGDWLEPSRRGLYAQNLASRPTPDSSDHKYSRGVLHIVAGSAQYPGAAVLSSTAAVTTGVGMLSICPGEGVEAAVNAQCPEVIAQEPATDPEQWKKVAAVVIGPGLGESASRMDSARAALEAAITFKTPCVVDASALMFIPELYKAGKPLGENILLTPHFGEARRLITTIGRDDLAEKLDVDPVPAVESLAQELGVHVLLKGASTICAGPTSMPGENDVTGSNQPPTVVHRTYAPGLATAGSGDVLAGMLGALAATSPAGWGTLAPLGSAVHAQAAHRIDPYGQGHFGASALCHR